MSTTPLDLPTLISQMPHVAKIAHVEQAKQEIQQQLYSPLLCKKIERSESRVSQINKKKHAEETDSEGHNQKDQHAHSKQHPKETLDEESESGASTLSPWAGNIINMKI